MGLGTEFRFQSLERIRRNGTWNPNAPQTTRSGRIMKPAPNQRTGAGSPSDAFPIGSQFRASRSRRLSRSPWRCMRKTAHFHSPLSTKGIHRSAGPLCAFKPRRPRTRAKVIPPVQTAIQPPREELNRPPPPGLPSAGKIAIAVARGSCLVGSTN
jgi:hypothetical protein